MLAAERPPQERMFYYDVFWDDDRQDFVSGVHRARNGATHFMDPELMPELPDEFEDFDDED